MKPLVGLLTAAVVLSCQISPANADRKSRLEEKARQERVEQQRQQVESILQQENTGQLTDRKQALKELIAAGDAPDEAYWQAGYIKRGDQWVSVGDRWLTPEQEKKLEEYTNARSDTVDSDEGHYKLAKWCAENDFDAQAYGHLKAVLLNHPDHAGLRQMLGYQKIGNRWMNAEDYSVAVRKADRLAKELLQWGPKVAKIRQGLSSSVKRNRISAHNHLNQITDVGAIPALELILLPSSDIGAALCVDQLCQIDHRRSSIALCKVAMYLPESAQAAKQAAVDELKTRPFDDFVPVLLGVMQTPMTMKYSFLHQNYSEISNGPFNLPKEYQQLGVVDWFHVELRNESAYEQRTTKLALIAHRIILHKDMVFRNGETALPYYWEMDRRNSDLRILASGESADKLGPSFQAKYDRVAEDTRRRAAEYVMRTNHILEETIDQENDSIDDFNLRATRLLSLITDQGQGEAPDYWWNWWKKRIEVETDTKQNVNTEGIVEVGETIHIPCSCFVAGTPVWTDRGPRPIDELQVGDMALTQNVETGELMYRPIIRTTTRKPKPLVTIDLGAEQITSTGGHPFFVVGEGWVRARELKAGQVLRTPTGTIKIESVTETPGDETYNLVIDGFHTYFVGMSQALVHDVSITSPSDAVVPGLLDR